MKRVLAFAVLATFAYCSSRPVLYENDKYKQVGERNANIDIDQCMNQAKKKSDASVGGIAKGGVRGAVRGGCRGLFRGDPIGGAASGMMGGVESGSVNYADKKVSGAMEGDTKEHRVQKCLEAKGYRVAGWD